MLVRAWGCTCQQPVVRWIQMAPKPRPDVTICPHPLVGVLHLQVDVVATLDAPLPTVSRGMATRLVRDRQVCAYGCGADGKGGCW